MNNQKSLEDQVADFNVDHPVGSTVSLRFDDGSSINTIVKSPASIVCGTAVGWLDGVPGCMDLDFIS